MATESTIPVPRGLTLPQKTRKSLPGALASFWAPTKPDINLLIVITVFISFGLAARFPQTFPLLRLLNAVLGTLLVSSGAAALNQFMERRHDGLMHRTKRRPVVLGGVAPRVAFIFGACVSAIGIVYLEICVNPLSSIIAAASLGIYLALYAPLKRVTPLRTWVGAIAGAAPPLVGLAEVSGPSMSLARGSWKDQIAAGAFMWVFGSLVFLVPAMYLTARFLTNGRLLDEKTGLERARAMAQ